MMGLAILRAAPPPNGLPIVHFAPERGLVPTLRARYGRYWTPADIDLERYSKSWVGKEVVFADLSQPSRYFRPASVGGFIHSHVLEHIPADVGYVLREMNSAVAPGGFHAFIVPIRTDTFEEDLSPSLPSDVRLARFGHVGHMRNFGRSDFFERVLVHFQDWKRIDLSNLITEEDLRATAIPTHALTDFSGTSVFMFIKPE